MGTEDERRLREDRQLRLMADRLDAFVSGKLHIAEAISDLEGLLWALEMTPEEWKHDFREQWGELEISYAVALDRQEPVPDASDPRIREAVRSMRRLVDERLHNA
jgi:hypothetical protein